MATELCGGTVVIQKLLDGQPAPGWAFSAPGGTPSAAATNAQGKLIFDWNSTQPQATDLTETQQPGYALVSSSCLLNGNPSGTAITNGKRLTVGPLDTIYCTFNNRTLTSGIDVQKTASPTTVTPGGLVTYTYVVTNTGEVALSNVTLTDDKCGPVTHRAPAATASSIRRRRGDTRARRTS